MKIKNIVWDWNGTIVDDAFLFVKIMNSVLDDYDLPNISLQYYKQTFCFPIQNYWHSLGFRFNKKQFNVVNKVFIQRYKKALFEPLLHKNIVSVFGELRRRGLSQFVLSASPRPLLVSSIKHYNIGGFFSSAWGVNNLNAEGKKSLALNLIKSSKIRAEETLMIGDTEYDYRVARAVGFTPLLVSCGHFNKKRLSCLDAPVVGCAKDVLFYLSTKQ